MSRVVVSPVLTGLALALLVPGPAEAREAVGQQTDYPYFRAYQQFLDSLTSSRTFAPPPDAPAPGFTPHGSQGPDVTPFAVPAPAYAPPPVSYNYARAYRHFLTSPYTYRTFSSLSPGYVTSEVTPYGYQWTFVGPAYTHQRITPRGFEGYSVMPGSRTEIVGPPLSVPERR
jgi:hypothetical protein